MLYDGDFRVVEDSPPFEKEDTTGNLVCTRVTYAGSRGWQKYVGTYARAEWDV